MVAVGNFCLEQQEATFSVSSEAGKSSPIMKRRRAVKFDERVRFRNIPSRRLLSKEEIRDCYMSEAEQQKIRGEIKSLLNRRVEQGDASCAAENEEELRGLESYYTPEANFARNQRKRLSLHAVLIKQSSGPLTDEWLTRVYSNFTQPSALAAYIRGLTDQQLDRESAPFNQMMIR
jgi:hypothetical protein